jgi:hypothetical protein
MGLDLTGLGAVANTIGSIVDKFLPDKTQQEKDRMALLLLQVQGEFANATAQMEVNKAEAANPSIFVSGWRPFIGWVCGAACAWNWIGIQITDALAAAFHYRLLLKPADLTEMMPILLGLLGMAGYRTFEKVKGVAAK